MYVSVVACLCLYAYHFLKTLSLLLNLVNNESEYSNPIQNTLAYNN